MPSITQVLEWQGLYPEFQAQYVRATEARSEHWLAELIEVGKAVPEYVADPATGRRAADSGLVAKARMVSENLKWALSRLHMKKYGDTQQLRHAGPDGGPIVVSRNTQLEILTDEQLDQLVTLADARAEDREAEGLGAVPDPERDAGEASEADPSGEKPT
jgi:hypothetical protein